MLDALLDSRVSFEIAALFVTWIAVALLVMVVGNLHVRLQRLEHAGAASNRPRPYAHLLGKQVQDLLGDMPFAIQPRVLVFLSSVCPSCKHVLSELKSPSWTAPSAIAWTDRLPSPVPVFPPNTIILDEGPRISTELGIQVTPFVLVASEGGRIVTASPINSLRSLGELVEGSVDFQPGHVPNTQLKEVSL